MVPQTGGIAQRESTRRGASRLWATPNAKKSAPVGDLLERFLLRGRGR